MAQQTTGLDSVAWYPDESVCTRSRLRWFLKFCESWPELYSKSTDDVVWFTERVLSFLDIRFDRPYTQLLDLSEG